jgi:hypothetical protein
MRRFHVLYDFVPSSLSESKTKLINFEIVVLNSRTKKNQAKDIKMSNTQHASHKKRSIGAWP